MIEIRPNCENCEKLLPPNSTEAMICSFECTFCTVCVENILENVCPNCGGNFVRRPIRPKEKLSIYPASTIKVYKPIDIDSFEMVKSKYLYTLPQHR